MVTMVTRTHHTVTLYCTYIFKLVLTDLVLNEYHSLKMFINVGIVTKYEYNGPTNALVYNKTLI
jgi:hypothetical protein